MRTIRPPDGERAALTTALEAALAAARRDAIDPTELGKAMAAAVTALRAALATAGIESVRLAAAAKALDLRTGKTELEAFVGGPP